ncbi:MAG: hypothetical protein AAGH17_08240, partial [Pseudomonadota bacterium]
MIWRGVITAGLLALAGGAGALDLPVPAGAEQTANRSETVARVAIPSGPYRDGFLPSRDGAGAKTIIAFRVKQPDIRALDLVAPVEDEL